MAKLDSSFYQKLVEVANNTGMNPEDILNVMAVESGLDPSAYNKHGHASGLTQFMPSTLKMLKFPGTHKDFREIGATQQLEYVEKLIRNMMRINGGPLTSAAQYYIGNFLPVALKLPGVKNAVPNTIIVSKNPSKPHLPGVSIESEMKYYNANSGLDYDKDGNITYQDIQSVLNRAASRNNFKSAINELKKYSPTSGSSQDDIYQKYLSRIKGKEMDVFTELGNAAQPSNNTTINSLLDSYLKRISASNRKLYKQYLPENNILIKVHGDFNESLEFSRILNFALNEELLADTSIHVQENSIEVNCCINGPSKICLATVEQFAHALKDVFIDAAKKINNIKLEIDVISNKKSFYQLLDVKLAEIEHRKFLLKLHKES